MILQIRQADFADPRDANGIVTILNSYAIEPVGGGRPLSPEVRERVVPARRIAARVSVVHC
jgi:hypothetical protein